MSRKVLIAGIVTTVVTDAEAEELAYRVCTRHRVFGNDIVAKCSTCGSKVYHRPFPPYKPPLVCTKCLPALLEAEGDGSKDEAFTTERTLAELRRHGVRIEEIH